MRIGILGSGLMGAKLGTLFARAGHDVVFSYARSESKLKRLAREAKGNARAGTPADAARDADAMLLAVHWSRVRDVLTQAGDVSGKGILSCVMPMNEANTRLVVGRATSAAETLAKRYPRAHFVSAFGTIPSEVIFGVFESKRRTRPSLMYCADDKAAKKIAATLIRDVGFEPMDLGPLATAKYLEAFTMLIAHLAYEGDDGPEIAYRSSDSQACEDPSLMVHGQRFRLGPVKSSAAVPRRRGGTAHDHERSVDRVAMHAVRRELLEAQAAATGLPLTVVPLPDARTRNTSGGEPRSPASWPRFTTRPSATSSSRTCGAIGKNGWRDLACRRCSRCGDEDDSRARARDDRRWP